MRMLLALALTVAASFALESNGFGAPPAVAPKESLPFIEDDYAQALAQARARKLPLFVDSWTTWCHTCRFLRAYVFTDPQLAKQSARFVWLSIDAEKEKNAGFIAKFPIEAYPTLLVIDPARETAVLRWPGSLNATQLVKLLDDGERAVRGGGDEGARERARADRLAGERKWSEAAEAYRAALRLVSETDRPRIVESLVSALSFAHDDTACAREAEELAPKLPRGPSFANAAGLGLGCALGMKGESGAHARASLTALSEQAVTIPGLLADDRSGLFEELVEAYEKAGDEKLRHARAEQWLTFLEGEAARAPSVEQRAAFDPHRVNAALALGQPLRAESALKATERDLPKDYNAPARLALIYRAAKRYDDALSAVDRALANVYGPRAFRLYDLKAGLLVDKGDRAGAKKTLEEALAYAKRLPAAQTRASVVADFQKRLESMR